MGRASRRKKMGGREQASTRHTAQQEPQSPGVYFVRPGRSVSILRMAAIHEAGHAVATIAQGLEVEYVILHDRWEGTTHMIGGYCSTPFTAEGADTPEKMRAAYNAPEMLRIRGIRALAGPAAEWLGHTDEHEATDIGKGAVDDDNTAIGCAIMAVGQANFSACYSEWDDAAHDLIRQYWPACTAIAEHLLANPNKRVPGAAVREIVAQSNKHGGQ